MVRGARACHFVTTGVRTFRIERADWKLLHSSSHQVGGALNSFTSATCESTTGQALRLPAALFCLLPCWCVALKMLTRGSPPTRLRSDAPVLARPRCSWQARECRVPTAAAVSAKARPHRQSAPGPRQGQVLLVGATGRTGRWGVGRGRVGEAVLGEWHADRWGRRLSRLPGCTLKNTQRPSGPHRIPCAWLQGGAAGAAAGVGPVARPADRAHQAAQHAGGTQAGPAGSESGGGRLG